MSENDKVVSDKELEAVEQEIKKKQSEEINRALQEHKKISEEEAKKIEERVRKEIQEKQEKDALQAKLKEQEEALKKAREETEAKIKAQEEAFEKRLRELEGQKRGVSINDNPFKNKEDNIDPTYQRKLKDGRIIDTRDPNVMKEIEEESRKAWMAKVGIQNPEWGKPRNSN